MMTLLYSRRFLWMALGFFLALSATNIGCNCDGAPPAQNDGLTNTDGGVIRPDGSETITEFDVDEQAPERPNPIDTPPDTITCYGLGDPCASTGQCNPSCSGDSLQCEQGICQSAVKPDLPPTDAVCPTRCSNHDDCRNTPACGDRRDCVNGVCSIPVVPCPRSCGSDRDCQTPLCGSRIRCNQGVCAELPKCPAGCTEDSDCNITSCGAKIVCFNGVCSEPIKNDPPVAVAEKSQKVEVATRVQLDGSKSSDPDGDPLTYRWNFISRPTGSLTDFDDATSAKPAFVPDREGDYQIILVVNDGKVDSKPSAITITAVKQISPAPTLTSFSPAQLEEGAANLEVHVFGKDIQAGASVFFNNLQLTAKFVNSTEIVVTLPGGLSAGSYPVYIQNPDTNKSNTLNYTIIKKPNDPPVLTVISPVEVEAGKAFVLTLSGDKFIRGAEVFINSTTYSTTFASAQNLTASIQSLAAGLYNVQVANPDGQRSAILTLRVVTVAKGPVLNSISPTEVFASQTFTLTLNGDRLETGAIVTVGTQTYPSTFVSAQRITVAGLNIAAPGVYPVEVENPGGLRSNRLVLTVKQALSKPILTLVVPSSITELVATTIAIRGNDFVQGAVVNIGGTDYPTSFVGVGELRVTLPNTIKAGTYPVQVTNPDKQQSNILNLTVVAALPKPTITSINPTRVAAGVVSKVSVVGTNFVSGAQVQVGARLVPTTFVSATELTAEIPSSLAAGNYELRVFNPDNQVSNGVQLELFKSPPPQITSLVPSKGTSGGVVTVRILGQNFFSTSVVLFQGGIQPSAYVSATELTVTLSLSGLNPGNYDLWVRNSDNQDSNKVTFVVEAPQGPQITSLLPSEGQTGTTINMIVSGARFATGAVIDFNGKPVTATFLNASTLGVALDLTGIAAGTYPFSVINPDKKQSNIVYFTVKAQKLPAPVITQVKPSALKLGSVGPNNPIYILGDHFQNGALLSFSLPFIGTIGLPTNFINSQTLVMTAQFPRIPFPFPAQSTNVFVTNPDQQTSNRVQITVSP